MTSLTFEFYQEFIVKSYFSFSIGWENSIKFITTTTTTTVTKIFVVTFVSDSVIREKIIKFTTTIKLI